MNEKPQYLPKSKIMNNFAKLCIISFFLLFIHDSLGQTITWQKTYGSPLDFDEGYCIVQTPDSGYIVGGMKSVGGTKGMNSFQNMYLFRMNKFGDLIWERLFADDEAVQIIKTTDNNYIAMGVFTNLVKFNINGDTLWKRGPFSAYNFTAIKELNNNGYIVCGAKLIGSNLFPYLLRINSQGDILWERTHSNGIFEGVYNDMIVENESFVIGANISDSGFISRKLSILKTDTSGNIIWTKKYDSLQYHTIESMIRMADGSYIIGGGNNNFVSKFDQNGGIIWLKRFDTFLNSNCRSIYNTYDGNFVQAGWWDSNGSSSSYIRVRKIDNNGNEIWRRSFGFSGAEYCYGIIQSYDSGFAIAGRTTYGGHFNQDVFVVKMDKNGNASPYIGIEPVSSIIPVKFNFDLPYPNPFNPQTKLNFDIPYSSKVTLVIYDILGRNIGLLIDDELRSGKYSTTFYSTNLPTGIYFAVLSANSNKISYIKTQKLILIK